MWDGVILTRAAELNDFRGIKLWFFESRWVGQYYLEYFLYWLSNGLNISFYQLSKIIQLLSLVISYFSIRKILILGFNFNNVQINIALISFVTFPIWHLMMTSNFTIYLLCYSFGLFCISKLLENNSLVYSLLYICLITLSFQLNSLIFFVPALFYAIEIYNGNNYPSKRTLLIIFYCLIILLLRLTLFKPYGLYTNYNSVNIFEFQSLIIDFLKFQTYFLLLYIFYSASILKIDKRLILAIIAVTFGGTLPYILTGHSNSIYQVWDWDGRQAILLSFAFSLSMGVIYSVNISNGISNKFLYIIIFINLILLSTGYLIKKTRIITQNKIVSLIDQVQIPNGSDIRIYSQVALYPYIRSYEINYSLRNTLNFNKANGEIKAQTYIKYEDEVINNKIISKNNLIQKYSDNYLINMSEKNCITNFYIAVDNSDNKIFYLYNSNNLFIRNVSLNCR